LAIRAAAPSESRRGHTSFKAHVCVAEDVRRLDDRDHTNFNPTNNSLAMTVDRSALSSPPKTMPVGDTLLTKQYEYGAYFAGHFTETAHVNLAASAPPANWAAFFA
jgi:hypothetical protein